MRATASSTPYNSSYFVLLDRLYDTLSQRFVTWKKKKGKVTGISKIRDVSGSKKKEIWEQRLLVTYDLASALRHLHGLK